jgi:hypothetical protein
MTALIRSFGATCLAFALLNSADLTTAQARCVTRERRHPPQLPRGAAAASAGRPSYALTVSSAQGYPFQVHGPSGSSTLLAKIRDAADVAWEAEIINGGWRAPPPDDGGPDTDFDFYIDPTLGTDEAYSDYSNDNDATSEDDAASYIGLPDTFTNDDVMRSTVAHELNHASQYAIDATEDDAFYEHTAVLVEQRVIGYVPGYGVGIGDYQDHPGRAIDYIGVDYYEYGAALWLMFLTEHVGNDSDAIVRQVWEDSAQSSVDWDNEPDFIDVLPGVLDDHGYDLHGFFAELATWRYFTGDRDDGMHFADGAQWDSMVTVSARTLGAAGEATTLTASLSAFGASFYTFNIDDEVEVALAVSDGRSAAGAVPLDVTGMALADPTTVGGNTENAVVTLPAGTTKLLVALTRVNETYDPDDDDWSTRSVSVAVTSGDTPVDPEPDPDPTNPGNDDPSDDEGGCAALATSWAALLSVLALLRRRR